MRDLDLAAYQGAFARIHGAFTMDAALLFFAYGALADEAGIRGSVVEIGVHHGLSAVAVAALCAADGSLVAIDTFGAHDVTASGGMSGDERIFRATMRRYHGGLPLRVIARDSRALAAHDVGTGFAFCHIDGGHSADETAHDLALAGAVSLPGGLVALDDYFNPSFPGVSEGAVRYLVAHPGELAPLAIGANKVLFQRAPARGDLGARFAERYPYIPRTSAVLDGRAVAVLGSGVAAYVDLERSTPARLVARELVLRVDLEPRVASLEAAPGEAVEIPVRVRNRSSVPLGWSDSPFGLSYHFPDRYENARQWFIPALAPGEERVMTLVVEAPERRGPHAVEIDVVWEGICWLRDRGNPPARVALHVR